MSVVLTMLSGMDLRAPADDDIGATQPKGCGTSSVSPSGRPDGDPRCTEASTESRDTGIVCSSSPSQSPTAEPAPALSGDAVAAWGALGVAARAVVRAPLWRLSNEQLVDLLRAQADDLARIEAARLGLLRELDTRGWAAEVGACSTASWVAQALRVDPRAAAADVRAARTLDPAGDVPPGPGAPAMTGAARTSDDPVLAATGRALAAGVVSRPHADAVLASIRGLPRVPDPAARADLTTRAEGFLLIQCAQFDPATVRRLGREVAHTVDPGHTLAEELQAAARDELWLSPTPAGRLRVRGEVDQVTGALLTTLVEAGAGPRPATGDGPDPRPACTRRAHAFGEVLRVAANAADTVRGGLNPQLLITVPLDSLRDALTARGLPTTLPIPADPTGDADGDGDGDGGPGTTDGDRLAAEHPALFAALRAAARAAAAPAGSAAGAAAAEASAAAWRALHDGGCRDSGSGSSSGPGTRRMAVLETGVPI